MVSAVLERSVPYNPYQVSFATPVNAGAHRLAWWMAPNPDAAIASLIRIGVSVDVIDRWITGDVVPAGDMVWAVAELTDGDVLPADWERKPTGTWGDAPIPHERLTA